MEEALDLRIHNRRGSLDEGFPIPVYYSSRVQFLLTTYKGEDTHDVGDLVIVEADTGTKGSNSLPSPSPGTRSSDTDPDKGSYSAFQHLAPRAQLDATDSEGTQSSSSSSKYTSPSKHVPSPHRMLRPTRLMCFLCEQKAKNGKTLETHIQKSHSIQTAQGRLLRCTGCSGTYESVDQLKSHYERSHTVNKTGETTAKIKAYYPCSHCSRMYRKQSLLDAHMRLVNQKDIWKKNNVYVNT